MEGPEARHAYSVMRVKKGDKIEIFDGKGKRFLAEADLASKSGISGRIISSLGANENEIKLTLCFALVSRQAVEEMLQRCTELGVSKFQPMTTARTGIDISGKWKEKSGRWNQIILAASKQCERACLPEILEPKPFLSLVEEPVPSFLAWEKEKERTLSQAKKSMPPVPGVEIRVFIGPEGGFTDEEAGKAAASGVVTFTFGKSILRAETACMAASAIILNG